MQPLCKGIYTARLADTAADLDRSLALRSLRFRAGRGSDADSLDAACRHVLIERTQDGGLVASFRVLVLASGAALGGSYSARFYDLAGLSAHPGPLVELGRFCLHPDHHDPDILRLAWAALTRVVDRAGAGMLIGCSSFDGADPAAHAAALAYLSAFLAPPVWRPGVRAARTCAITAGAADPRQALAGMPPLLRTYLMMGGRFSDHAVIDTDLDTLHVFTGVEIAAIPPARARALRALAD